MAPLVSIRPPAYPSTKLRAGSTRCGDLNWVCPILIESISDSRSKALAWLLCIQIGMYHRLGVLVRNPLDMLDSSPSQPVLCSVHPGAAAGRQECSGGGVAGR